MKYSPHTFHASNLKERRNRRQGGRERERERIEMKEVKDGGRRRERARKEDHRGGGRKTEKREEG